MTEAQKHAFHLVYTLAQSAVNIEGGAEDVDALNLLAMYDDGTLIAWGPTAIKALPHMLRLAQAASDMWTATPEETQAIVEVSALAAQLAKGAA